MPVSQIRGRDGKIVTFDPSKITKSIHKAILSAKMKDGELAEKLSAQVVAIIEENFKDKIPSMDDVPNIVEKILIKNGHDEVAKAYILYRQWLKDAFDDSPDAITVIDLDATIIDCNQATSDRLGYSSKEELIGKNAFEFFAKKDRERAMENLKKTLEQGLVRNAEYTFITKDGNEFPGESSTSVIRDSLDSPAGFIVHIEDISERKKAEEALRESEQRYRTLFDSACDAIFIHDFEGKLLEVNRAACERLGYSREELLKMTLMDIDTPDFLVPKRIEELRQRGQAFSEVAHRRKDGTVIPVELSSRTMEYAGKPAILSIARDITERKRVEAEARKLVYKSNGVVPGECYISESHEWCLKAFVNLNLHNIPGLCVVRDDPEKLVQEYGLKTEQTMLLSSRPLRGFRTLSNLQEVSIAMSEFLKTGGGVVFLDGLEYLVTRFSFEAVYKMLQEKRFDFLDAGAVLLIPVALETLNAQEKALLLSELKILK